MKLPPHPTAALLEHQPFLRGVPWRQLETLAAHARYQFFLKDTLLLKEGEEARQFFLLLTGEVSLFGNDPEGRPVAVQALGAGEAVGWSWAFPPYRWSFTAMATADVESIAFDAVWLRQHCDDDPALAACLYRRVADILLQRLQATRRRLTALQHAAAGIPIRLTVVPAGSTFEPRIKCS